MITIQIPAQDAAGILKQLTAPTRSPDSESASKDLIEIAAALREFSPATFDSHKIAAIKFVRRITGCSLAEAKNAVESV